MLTASANSVDEGASVDVSLTDGMANTDYAYTITGVDAADIDLPLTGTFTTDANGAFTGTINAIADLTTEGAETMSIAIDGTNLSTDVVINDTSVAPQTVELTIGNDTVPAADGAQTITGTVSALSILGTLNPGDKIDGGAGDDILSVDMQGNFTGFSGDGSLANVETVKLANSGTILRTFDASGATGVKSYEVTGSVNLNDLDDATTSVSLSGRASQDFTAGYTTDAVKGTTDTFTLSVNNVGTVKAGTVNEEDVQITAAGFEKVALTATGDNVLDMNAANATSMTVEGAGNVKMTDVGTALKTFDATKSTGNIEIAVDDADDMTTIATGSGDDKVTTFFDDVTANAQLSGGDGSKDVLAIVGAGATVEFNQSGFETMSLELTGSTTMSLKNTSGVQTIAVEDGQTEDAVLANASGDVSVQLKGANGTENKGLTVDHDGAVTVTVDTPAATATTAVPSVNKFDVVATKAQVVNLNVADKMDFQGQVSGTVAGTANISIEGKTSTADAEVSFAKASSVIISKVTNASQLKVTAGEAKQVDINNAKDLNLTDSTLSKVETFTATGTGGIIGNFNLAAVNQANFSNSGDIDLGALGSLDQDYSLNLTSTGSKSFDAGTLTTKNQAINANVTDGLGVVALGAVNSGTGSTTINVGTTGAASLAAITAGSVNIDLANVLGAVTYGGLISASGNLTIVGSNLQDNNLAANDIKLTGAAGSTQAVSLTGGIKNDTVDINTAAVDQTVNVSGDLSIGTNAVVVTGAAGKQTISIASLSNYGSSTITGDAGDDTITGGSLKDTINGGDDKDTISAGAGEDEITGGAGADNLTGGTGADTFKGFDAEDQSIVASAHTFNATDDNIAATETITFATTSAGNVDVIVDFVSGTDKLDVTTANTAPTTLIGVDSTAALTDGTAYVAYGSYDATTGVFTVAAAFDATTAKDALFVEGDGTETAINETDYVVLTGLNQALVAADFV